MDSFIGWIGGKKLLRKAICAEFPQNFDRYIEVFGGAGWVLFHKDRHAELEVYNDINSNLVNLFRCIKYHSNAVHEELRYVLNSRETFDLFKSRNYNCMTDIQKAAQYMYLIKHSYGAKVATFGAKPKRHTAIEKINAIQKRLETVIIENKSFDALIKQYDRETALFYCDPPYFEAEKFYDTGDFVFNKSQHIKLKEMLTAIKGKVILSYNDCAFIRELYRGFHIIEIGRQNNLASRHGKDKVYKELIIKSY